MTGEKPIQTLLSNNEQVKIQWAMCTPLKFQVTVFDALKTANHRIHYLLTLDRLIGSVRA